MSSSILWLLVLRRETLRGSERVLAAQRNAMQRNPYPNRKQSTPRGQSTNQPANQPVMRSQNTKTKTSNRSRPRETNFEPIHRGSKGIAAPGSDFWNRRLLDKPDANQPTNQPKRASKRIYPRRPSEDIGSFSAALFHNNAREPAIGSPDTFLMNSGNTTSPTTTSRVETDAI
mmetsp:Transcript_19644/g.54823  ORF Transcript_19644/g.54823 Transcript_19644/m.54823 type:complete len:173 (-) Transcript_19644:633-1151(-)